MKCFLSKIRYFLNTLPQFECCVLIIINIKFEMFTLKNTQRKEKPVTVVNTTSYRKKRKKYYEPDFIFSL